FEVCLQAVEEVRKLVPAGATMAALSLRWILMSDAVTVVIPGARNGEQARANAAAADLAPLSADLEGHAGKGLADIEGFAVAVEIAMVV
ncbi:aldo/keto reductase, partial [Rhizobium ruizarguesonis]